MMLLSLPFLALGLSPETPPWSGGMVFAGQAVFGRLLAGSALGVL